jgi:hypothetical protein
MVLGGVTVDDQVVRRLALLLNEPLRGKLERALSAVSNGSSGAKQRQATVWRASSAP